MGVLAANRWTDNILMLTDWMQRKKGVPKDQVRLTAPILWLPCTAPLPADAFIQPPGGGLLEVPDGAEAGGA